MAFVTPIGAYNEAQINYRLGGGNGCQMDYHLNGQERPLQWIGDGLGEVGIQAGDVLGESNMPQARALMAGIDPSTGEQLVEPKLAVYNDAKLPLTPLVAAVREKIQQTGESAEELLGSAKQARLFAAAERAVEREGEAAMRRADEAGVLADAAGVDVDQVWGSAAFTEAVENLNVREVWVDEDGEMQEKVTPRRRSVGNAGYDVTFTLPKSMSLFLAFSPAEESARIEDLYAAQVGRTFGWLEQQTAYGMRGKHGGGKSAEVTEGSGFLGWTMVHRAARPVDGREVGDPHWHVHATIANMTRSTEDGQWSTVAAGGRDLMRHAPATGKILRAMTRHQLAAEYGLVFARSERTQAWEIAGIPDEVLRHFSRRGESIQEVLRGLGMDEQRLSVHAERIAEAQSRGDKTHTTEASDETLRMVWLQDAESAGIDVDQVMHDALHPEGPQEFPDALVAELVERLQDPEEGLTGHSRRFSKLDAMGAVAENLPGGLKDLETLDRLTGQVLADAGFVDLDMSAKNERGINHSHLQNAELMTTADVIAAEEIIFARLEERGGSYAQVEEEVALNAISVAETGQGFELTEGQRVAVLAAVTSDQAVDAILGPPGTGKTTIMRSARVAWQAEGYTVMGAATAAVAAQQMQNESGIQARTIASVLMDPDRVLADVDVLVIDEANLTDDRARAELYRAASEHQVKIVEIGDPKQLRGIGCGSLFGQVHGLVRGPELVRNRRQHEPEERHALALWRAGDYEAAWQSWDDRGRLAATETCQESVTAMVGEGVRLRRDAPNVHDAISGVVMLAGTRQKVEALNTLSQAVRVDEGEVSDVRRYAQRLGRHLDVGVGDQVMIRINSLGQRQHSGDDVLNGYRGVVTATRDDGVDVEWREHTPDGDELRTATLPAEFIARGGLELGYAMTTHKAEGLTVSGDWQTRDGEQVRGTVLVDLHGLDNPATYVAGSRHKGRFVGFAAREAVESVGVATERGKPASQGELVARVMAALAQNARRTAENMNDQPVTAPPQASQRDLSAIRDQLRMIRERNLAGPGRVDAREHREEEPAEHRQREQTYQAEVKPGRGIER